MGYSIMVSVTVIIDYHMVASLNMKMGNGKVGPIEK